MTEDVRLAATTVEGRTRAAMTRELLAAAEAGRVRIAIGRASDFFCARRHRLLRHRRDPLVRVITAVVSVMGGARVLAYLAAWILIPAEGESSSMAGVPARGAESAVTALVWPCSPPELL
jgi:hypothetical protein